MRILEACEPMIESGKSLRIGKDVHFDNLPILDDEAHDRKQLSTWKPRNDSRAPFTSTGCIDLTSREKVSACSATARAPCTTLDAPAGTAPPSARSTTFSSSTARSALMVTATLRQ